MARTAQLQSTSSERDASEQFFVKDGSSVKFWFYQRDDEEGYAISQTSAQALARKIRRHGGTVVDDEEDADVVLVKDDYAAKAYGLRYSGYPNSTYVEPTGFVTKCINKREYEHTPQPLQGMPGRPGGRIRHEFTGMEDEQLAVFLACRLPDKEQGGRTGNSIYQQLTLLAARYPEYSWARQHTWQSWRERYKKNSLRFDKLIEAALVINPTPLDQKGVDRRRRGARREASVEHDEDEEHDGDAHAANRAPSPQDNEDEDEDPPDVWDSDFERVIDQDEARVDAELRTSDASPSQGSQLEDDEVGGLESFEVIPNTQQTLVASQQPQQSIPSAFPSQIRSHSGLPVPRSPSPPPAPVPRKRPPTLREHPRPRPTAATQGGKVASSSQATLVGQVSSQPQRPSSQRRRTPPEIPDRLSSVIDESSIQDGSRTPAHMLPLRKRQRIQVIEPPDVGPSRHHGVARSSNRTGETVALELRGGKGPLRAADVSLRNSSQAEEESEQDEDDLIAPAGLSTDDEQSRRRLFNGGIAQVPSRPSTSMPSGNRHSRRPSQASSDAQPLGNEATRFLSVRTPQRQRRPTRLYTSDDSDDGDDDSDEQGTRSSSVSNLQREELFSAQNGHEAPVPTFNMPSSQSYTTGMRQSFYMPSDEGDGSVPLTGTRASVEKLKRKRESLETPFKPPSGTRAAQLILSQQRQTDRN